jgi:hypothetical protein
MVISIRIISKIYFIEGFFILMTSNGLRLCEEADFGAQNFHLTTKVDAR